MGYRPAVSRSLSIVVAVVVALVLAACGSDDEASRFGPVVSTVDEIVGTELAANRVVSMPCIESRRDPVGVWIAMRVTDAELDDGLFTLDLQQTDARLGSHPSGCRNPAILLAQSVFLFDGRDLVFARDQEMQGESTRLVFAVGDQRATEFDLVILPTFTFDKGDGRPETTIFGLLGRYSLS